jgi:hypothetical protein
MLKIIGPHILHKVLILSEAVIVLDYIHAGIVVKCHHCLIICCEHIMWQYQLTNSYGSWVPCFIRSDNRGDCILSSVVGTDSGLC